MLAHSRGNLIKVNRYNIIHNDNAHTHNHIEIYAIFEF